MKSHHGDTETRRKAAKKAAKTRAANKASAEYYYRVTVPAMRRTNGLIITLLRYYPGKFKVHWNPTQPYRKLMKGAEYGTLVGVAHGGRYWRVLVDGYKRPQLFHASLWEVLSR